MGKMIEPDTYSLDGLYLMISSIYGEQNYHRSPSSTFAHFVEVCGMLTVHDKRKRNEGVSVEDALCKALGWFFPLMAKFRVASVEEMIYLKYPYVCPYCRLCPHDDGVCKTTRGVARTLDHSAVLEKREANRDRRPKRLSEWQLMFNRIYRRDLSDAKSARSTLGLFEEIGELAEAVRVFERYPKYFAGEAADVFSYLMGIANEHQLKVQEEDKPPFDLETSLLTSYPGMCTQCGHQVCICPSIPESTVGRLAKEMDLPASGGLFAIEYSKAEKRGKQIGDAVLQDLGGLAAFARQIPLDRGEANRALFILLLKLAGEIERTDQKQLAIQLQTAAKNIASESRMPGSKAHGQGVLEVFRLLESVWPLLKLAVIPNDGTLQSTLGAALRAQSVKIGIITALPKEFAAMLCMLDEHENVAVANDPNDYVLGRIPSVSGGSDHMVAVTLQKEIGTNGAASAATNLMRSFPNVEDVLMVGIAGGIPCPDNTEKHVRLGDIVVSSREGILQYDNLKVDGQTIEIRSSTSKPSARMINAVNRLETNRLLRQYPWEDLIENAANRIESGARPDDNLDVFVSGEPPTRSDHPTDPNRRPGNPRIHLGRIGAANTLLKNRNLREQLRSTHNVRAIEMEGCGIADATWTAGQNYLVIRGICDYCDENKNDLWQNYAAVAAAAYARAVISVLNSGVYKQIG
jgi:nucleoside phosphorylase/NTP pyrophosphatase (non-canonical NTP hydrolase)